jgi:hypothetical protein
MTKHLALTALLAIALAACADEAAPAQATSHAASRAASQAERATMPFSIERLTESFEGSASEVLRVSGYTYVAVDTGAGTRWAVSLAKDIDEGARVRVRAFGKKEAFESKKLGRTFDELWFAIITQVPVTEVTEGASS